MNLIKDAWIPVIRASGKARITPWQIAEQDDPVLELDAPRPDFQGALYQLLIGLLQTAFAPQDHDEWLEFWEESPDTELLRTRFDSLACAFNLSCSDGPAFMQDYALPDGEKKKIPISSLLIEAPGNKTSQENLDHFIKRGTVKHICAACAAMALFTLQTNAPSGGNGHRVGLRGGGPLTTLVLPPEKATLWRKLWLNILDSEDLAKYPGKVTSDIFPWMGPTRASYQKMEGKVKRYINGGVSTTPEDTHALQMYWGMPRRIRIESPTDLVGTCDVCGDQNVALLNGYRTSVWGVDYIGEWVHPLTPYRFDPNKENPPLSLKGQQGGLGYRHWLGLMLSDPYNGDSAAKVTKSYLEKRGRDISGQRVARLWCFGFDMDNMKARCWYDHTLPIFALDPIQRDNVLAWAGELINAARDVAENLRRQVKAAWFRRPEDVKGDMSVVQQEFWQKSETDFYRILNRLCSLPGSQRQLPAEFYDEWLKIIQSLAYRVFDAWALESPAEDLDMKRIVAARDELRKKLYQSKPMKALIEKSKPQKEGTDGRTAAVPIS